jgi:1-deoxy-D-xylulose-5-phosphate reductoisomerase
LNLAYQALRAGGTAPTILNAANEVAVQAFLDNKIAFTDIAIIVDKILNVIPSRPAHNLEIILQDNATARECALGLTHISAPIM